MERATNGTAGEVFQTFLELGLTSFGGPVAHLGYFREEFVARRKWLDDRAYADLVALCQFLPGPASSQTGFALGLFRAGYGGAFAAWCGFTLPSAILIVLFAANVEFLQQALGSGWLGGLKTAAVAVVAHAVLGMARSLAPDAPRAGLALLGALLAIMLPSTWGQIAAIAAGGIIGYGLLPRSDHQAGQGFAGQANQTVAVACLLGFFVLLAVLPLAAYGLPGQGIAVFDAFYRAGALVFGGGHVVLPLLQKAVVAPGWVGEDAFLAGYGAAQAVPGPLFTFAAYLGAVMSTPPMGVAGAVLCLVAIFLPSFLLMIGVLPFWHWLRAHEGAQAALKGINAGVVGLLAAALYDPVWPAGIQSAFDFGLAAAAFLALAALRLPAWAVVLGCALGGGIIASLQAGL